MEDDTACSLCLEGFTDPVSLPCGHGFCRGCLKSVVDHNSEINSGQEVSDTILPCPLCRAELTLGPRGLDELQPNQDLSNLMLRRSEVKDAAVSVPACDMCDGDNRQADHYCENCMILYCEQCLKVTHPPRGPLRRHQLMSIKQYLSEKSSYEADLKPNITEAHSNVGTCVQHKHPLSLFCCKPTCDRPICTECMPLHQNHMIHDVITAYNRNKPPVEDQIDCCRVLKTELHKFQTEIGATQKDIQTKIDQEYMQIEENYERSLKSLQDWRKSERDKVDEKRDKLATLKKVNTLIEETDCVIASSVELLLGNEALFLLESKELLVRLQCHSTESNQALEENRRTLTALISGLRVCDFRPCVLTVLAPQLKFIESTDPGGAIIQEDGMTVMGKPGESARNATVRTDGLITQTRYWEMEATWGVSSPPTEGSKWKLVCIVGVRQEGSDFSSRLGYDSNSYGVQIGYNHDTNSYRIGHVHEENYEICSNGNVSEDDSVSHRLGFFLQTSDETLTVIDLNKDIRLQTFTDVDVSRPFIPVVYFSRVDFQRTFSLPPVDQSSQLEHLFGILSRLP